MAVAQSIYQMKKALFALTIVFSLSGCVVVQEAPEGKGGPHHCPPGQAKKGRC
jgi:hypothetical protein